MLTTKGKLTAAHRRLVQNGSTDIDDFVVYRDRLMSSMEAYREQLNRDEEGKPYPANSELQLGLIKHSMDGLGHALEGLNGERPLSAILEAMDRDDAEALFAAMFFADTQIPKEYRTRPNDDIYGYILEVDPSFMTVELMKSFTQNPQTFNTAEDNERILAEITRGLYEAKHGIGTFVDEPVVSTGATPKL